MSLLQLQQVDLTYPSRHGLVHALADVSLTVTAGEFICVVGPSGCGKTTLLRIVAGLLFPTSGAALMDGQPIVGPAADRGIVFQQPALYPWLTVADNVAFGLQLRKVPRAVRQERVNALLKLVGLADFGRRAPYELSGGMQQRAAIARVLINEPRIMLMDEPFGALDALTREHMQEELRKIWRATQTTIILITHSVEEAVYLGTRVLVMSPRPGRVVADVPVAFSREAGESRAIKARPDFVAARETILNYIWREEEGRLL
ncbi:MAG: ABC transporter ATP-binding protein [Caldilineaceae bacterium]|nr:ABC transporter ATP-binding protein [Caldilineaceae bacterium]